MQRRGRPAFDPRRCLALAGSPNGDGINDVLAVLARRATRWSPTTGTTRTTASTFDVIGIDDPFDGLTLGFNGPDGADNQNMSASFVSTSGILPRTEFPQFDSWPSSR